MTTTTEEKRGRGRPPEGTPVEVRIPADLLAEIDALAARQRMPRAAMIRELIRMGLDPWS